MIPTSNYSAWYHGTEDGVPLISFDWSPPVGARPATLTELAAFVNYWDEVA